MSTDTKPDSERFYDELRELTIEYNTNTMTVGEFLTKAVALHEAYVQERETAAKKEALDHIIDLQDKQFNRWTQKDIANFFDGVGKYYRAIEAELSHTTKGGSDV